MAKRLIDAKAFDLRLSQKKITEVFPDWKKLPQEIREAVCEYAQYFHMLLETQPTVDAVEVVRCRECKYIYFNKAYNSYLCRNTNGLTSHLKADYFCSYGERRTDE